MPWISHACLDGLVIWNGHVPAMFDCQMVDSLVTLLPSPVYIAQLGWKVPAMDDIPIDDAFPEGLSAG